MGYTHYWRGTRSTIDADAWDAAVKDCEKIIGAKHAELRLDVEHHDDGRIWVNGDESRGEDHETFEILTDPDTAAASDFEFCKTAQKPYDVVVTACLARLAEAGLWVDSDGDATDWAEGLALAERLLGRPFKFPIDLRK